MAGDPNDESQSGALVARYANFFRVGFSEVEFLIDFGQEYEGIPARVHTRIVISPAYIGSLMDLLRGAAADYRRAYGGPAPEAC